MKLPVRLARPARLAPVLLVLFAVTAFAQEAPPPREPPTPFERHIVHVDGERPADLSVVVLRAADPAHARGTLVMLHGYRLRKEIFYGYDPLRTKLDWNLVMFDFRGHGESSGAKILLGVDETRDARAVLDLCDDLKLAGPRALYGISMGASVGLLTGAEDSRVRGVFAVSPYENAYDAVGLFSRAVSGFDLTRSLVPPDQVAALKATDVRAALAGRSDLRIKLICGSEDCFPEAMQKRILDAAATPDAMKSLTVGEGYSHFDIPSWREITPLLLKFLEEVRADAASGPATRPTTRATTRPATRDAAASE